MSWAVKLVYSAGQKEAKRCWPERFRKSVQERSPSDEDLPVEQPGLGLIFPPVSGTNEAYSYGANSFFLSPNSVQKILYTLLYILYTNCKDCTPQHMHETWEELDRKRCSSFFFFFQLVVTPLTRLARLSSGAYLGLGSLHSHHEVAPRGGNAGCSFRNPLFLASRAF